MPATTTIPEAPLVPVVKKKYPMVLPYVTRILEQLRRVFRSFDIPAYFKVANTPQQLLVHSKDKVEKANVVGPVYHISCDDCDAMYVSETERSLKARFLEHQRKSTVGSEVSQHLYVGRPEHEVS